GISRGFSAHVFWVLLGCFGFGRVVGLFGLLTRFARCYVRGMSASVLSGEKRREGPEDLRVVAFRLEAASYERLKAIARANFRTVSDELRSRPPELMESDARVGGGGSR